jgi:hypothetical protein
MCIVGDKDVRFMIPLRKGVCDRAPARGACVEHGRDILDAAGTHDGARPSRPLAGEIGLVPRTEIRIDEDVLDADKVDERLGQFDPLRPRPGRQAAGPRRRSSPRRLSLAAWLSLVAPAGHANAT